MGFVLCLVLFHNLQYAFQCVQEVHCRRFCIGHCHLTVVIPILVMPLHDKTVLGSRNIVFQRRFAGLIIYALQFYCIFTLNLEKKLYLYTWIKCSFDLMQDVARMRNSLVSKSLPINPKYSVNCCSLARKKNFYVLPDNTRCN